MAHDYEKATRPARRKATATAWGYAAGRHLPPTPWKILMVLVERVNNRRDDYEVWPDQHQIATDANLSLSTVQRHLRTLEADGFFKRRMRDAPGRGFTGWVYILNVQADFTMPNGRIVAEKFYEQAGEPTRQNDVHRHVTGDAHRHVTGDVSYTEHENREHENREPPLTPPAGADGGDLFNGALPSIDLRLSDEEIEQRYLAMWADACSRSPKLEPVGRFGPDRRDDLMARIAQYAPSRLAADVDAFFSQLMTVLLGSRHMRGVNDRGWVPTYGWVLLKKNCSKMMDGFYARNHDDSAGGAQSGGYATAAATALDVILSSQRTTPLTAREVAFGSPRRSPYDRP